jgi:hypothetical protein
MPLLDHDAFWQLAIHLHRASIAARDLSFDMKCGVKEHADRLFLEFNVAMGEVLTGLGIDRNRMNGTPARHSAPRRARKS